MSPELESRSPKARWKAFFKRVSAPDTVSGRLAYSSARRVRSFSKASSTAAEVILPSCAKARSEPSGTLIPSAMACASRGVCSMTELNSSPRNCPEAKACPSCINAPAAASLEAPESDTAWPMASVAASTSA